MTNNEIDYYCVTIIVYYIKILLFLLFCFIIINFYFSISLDNLKNKQSIKDTIGRGGFFNTITTDVTKKMIHSNELKKREILLIYYC